MAESNDEGPTVLDEMAETDLDALFARVKNGEGTQWDHDHFDAAMMYRYCQRVYAGEEVEPWIMTALANAFFKVLAGGEWEAEITLPDRAPEPIRPWREQRDLEIFCYVSNSADTRVTATLTDAAAEFDVSYETARAAYYKWRKHLGDLSKKTENS